MAVPANGYDPRAALYAFAPGVLLTRENEQQLVAQYAANGYTPLTQAQVLAITGPLPPLVTGIQRLPVTV